jgi:putative membrane protein
MIWDALPLMPPRMPIVWRLVSAVGLAAVYSALVVYLANRMQPGSFGEAGIETAVVDGIIISVLLAFRIREAAMRWWDARGLWGLLVNDTRNLCLKVRQNPAIPPADVRQLARLLTAFPHSLRLHLRGDVRLQAVPGFETAPDNPGHVPLYLADRIQELLAGWRRAGKLDGFDALLLDEHFRGLMNVCGACEKIRNSPLAPSFRALLRYGIALNILLTPWTLATTAGYWTVPFVSVTAFFLFGVEFAAHEIEEPFGKRGDDLSLEAICETIAASVAQELGTSDSGTG